MSRYLLDVNVLVALFDPRHVYHKVAHDWWSKVGKNSWASTNTTENGFVRVVSNPAYPGLDLMPSQAIKIFSDFVRGQKTHKFWSEELSIIDELTFDCQYIAGHKQITDVYLLAVAKYNNGKLATFDQKIEHKAIRGGGLKSLEIIK